MSTSAKTPLPGRLGNPELSLATDPRADPRMVDALGKVGLAELAAPSPLPPDCELDDRRGFVAAFEEQFGQLHQLWFGELEPVSGVESSEVEIDGTDGNRVRLYVHRPANADGDLPCVVHFHGGGMVMFEAAWPGYVRWRDELAAAGLVVVGVEFRNGAGVLGPHPYPAGLNDCAAAVKWVFANRTELGVSKIVVSGESGGGNLTLATTLKAKREGWIDHIAGVYAQCPFISNEWDTKPVDLPSLTENDGYLLDVGVMDVLARVYDPDGAHSDDPLCWPYRASASDLAGLPPHVISVNELDPFRDEGLAYARNALAAGVSVVSRISGGTCHAGDTILREDLADVYLATVRDIAGFARSL